MNKKVYILGISFFALLPLRGNAFWEETKLHFKQILCRGQNELYIPVNTWHNRWTYDRENIRKYNERPWGIGFGKVLFDEDHKYSLGFMEFQDSHNDIEPIFAYKWQKVWRLDKTVRPTLGWMAGITMRSDYNYVPIPAVLPVFGIDIGPFSLESTYVPALGKNNGNVLFTWVQWRF